MPSIQYLIHKFEEQGGRGMRLAFVVLVTLGLLVCYHWRAYRNYGIQESMDAAQLARNLAEGKGFTTDFVRPFSIHLVSEHNKDRLKPTEDTPRPDYAQVKGDHPDIANAPLYPLFLAGAMKVLPFDFKVNQTDPFWSIPNPNLRRLSDEQLKDATPRMFFRYQPEFIVSLINQLLLILAAVLTALLARRLFDAQVAWMSYVVIIGCEYLWHFSTTGLSTMLLLNLFLGLVWLLVWIESEEREPVWSHRAQLWLALGIGALLGLGTLTRYSFGWLAIPVLVYLCLFCVLRRWMIVSVVTIVFLGFISPWIVRNMAVSGTPFGIAGYALVDGLGGLTEHRLGRALRPDFSDVGLFSILLKLAVNFREIVTNELPRLGGSWVSALFLTGLLLPFRSVALRRLRYFLLAALVVLAIVQSFGKTQLSEDSPVFNTENLLVLVVPLIFVYGSGLFFLLLDQMNLKIRELRYLVMGAFGLLACLPFLLIFLTPKARVWSYPPYFPPTIQTVSGYMKPNELMMSDIPWAVAWYGDRQCVWLTANAEADYFAIHDFLKPIKALYLTPLTTDSRFLSQWVRPGEKTWPTFVLEFVLRRSAPQNFPLRFARDGLFPEQLFLCDYDRWREDTEGITAPPTDEQEEVKPAAESSPDSTPEPADPPE